MPSFRYTAIESGGKRVIGEAAAPSEQALLADLESRRLTPVQVSPAPERRRRGVPARELGQRYVQLAELLHAGVPLLRSLRLLGARRSQPRLSEAFAEIAESVAQGGDLAESMGRRPEMFPDIHVAMVRAGEKGGFLDDVFARLGRLVNGQAELRSRIMSALVYPAMLASVGTVVLLVIFTVFIPRFRAVFEGIPGGPPALTRFVFRLSRLTTTYGPYTGVALALLAFGLWRWVRSGTGARMIGRAATFSPVVGPIVRSLASARFCRMLGTMLSNGVPMLTAMQISRQAAGNLAMEEAVGRATEAVRAGQPLARPLQESGLFEDDVVEMIGVAEAANRLDAVLVTIADTIEARVDRLLTTAVRLIEPLLLLVLAGAVVLVAGALILPMLKLSAGM